MIIKKVKETLKQKQMTAEEKLMEIGWENLVANNDADDKDPHEEAVKRIASLIKSIEGVIPSCEKAEGKWREANSWFWKKVDITGESHPSRAHGKVYDIMWVSDGYRTFTITYNMYGDSPKYVAYIKGNATPIAKMRNKNEIGEFLREKLSR